VFKLGREFDMAEQKKRGFHALEQRIHQMEEEDAAKKPAATEQPQQPQAPRVEPSRPKPRK